MADELRTLDAEVARVVFGLVPCDEYAHEMLGVAGHGWVRLVCEHPPDACYPSQMGPYAYSTDMSLAWLVVKRVFNQRFSVRNRFIEAIRDQMIVEGIGRIDPSHWVFFLTPERICEAALKALRDGGG